MADGATQSTSYYSLQPSHIRMSMRDKSLLKRRVNKEHSSNFRAGYVHVNEEHLHKTGLRGRKRYVFYAFLILLLLMVLGNLVVTIVILSLLRISHTGIAGMEFISPSLVLRFLTDADMGAVFLNGSSRVTSFQDLAVTGENQPIHMMVAGNVSSVNVLPHVTRIVVKDAFKIIHPQTGKVLFSTDFKKGFSHPFKHMETAEVLTNKFTMLKGAAHHAATVDYAYQLPKTFHKPGSKM
ncbi:beta-sarcoglycan-like [Lingula anatina]|uniref:Beta-sarcoglycan n=1 Tax=Lingula anatina TaxID=7574 RepID=A0A1S3K1I8_LINAN|nr:beta-sarcoglycan-like [Lingula anatina]|eukprot:XP_013416495.1 beta-sarcoglycan-like [Lingula anatina]